MLLEGRRVLLGVSGGIAAYKTPELARRLADEGAAVQAVLTPAGARFVSPLALQAVTGREALVELFDAGREGRISHIELARWADVVLVAPATADLIARAAHGLADDLLTTLLLAARCPVVLAPAMNPAMGEHPATQANLAVLRAFPRHHLVEPDTGDLACGEVGPGRLPDPPALVEALRWALAPQDLAGRRVLVTAGPTREPLDAVRFLSNRSTGRMGYAIARAARARGAEVVLVAGPTDLPAPPGVEVVPVTTAADLGAAVNARAGGADVVVMAAAVSDSRPARPAQGKLPKAALGDALPIERTADVLAELGAARTGGRPLLVGFAAETSDLDEAAARKLPAKRCDLLVANRVDEAGSGFGTDTNRVVVYDRHGGRQALDPMTKDAVADRLCDRVARWLAEGT